MTTQTLETWPTWPDFNHAANARDRATLTACEAQRTTEILARAEELTAQPPDRVTARIMEALRAAHARTIAAANDADTAAREVAPRLRNHAAPNARNLDYAVHVAYQRAINYRRACQSLYIALCDAMTANTQPATE